MAINGSQIQEALKKKYGPLPGAAWLFIIAAVLFYMIKRKMDAAKSGGTNADGSPAGKPGEFSSTQTTKDANGNTVTYTAKGPTTSYLSQGALGGWSAGAMPSSAGDIFINLPGQTPPTVTTPPQVTTVATSPKTYTVKKGDTLWKIHDKFYPSGAPDYIIYNANKAVIGNDPNSIAVGQVLTIPDWAPGQAYTGDTSIPAGESHQGHPMPAGRSGRSGVGGGQHSHADSRGGHRR